jgi:hypothetical protein
VTTYVLYGGTGAELLVSVGVGGALLVAPGATLPIYDAPSGGTQVTDLKDELGNAVTVATANSQGFFRFQASDTYAAAGLWAETGLGFRLLVRPVLLPAGTGTGLAMPAGAVEDDVIMVGPGGTVLKKGRLPEIHRATILGDLVAATGPTDSAHVVQIPIDVPFDLKYVKVALGLASEGAAVIVKAWKKARSTQVYTEVASKTLTAATLKYDVATLVTPVHFAAGDTLVIGPSQVGSTSPGADLRVAASDQYVTLDTPLTAPNAPTIAVSSPDGTSVLVTITPSGSGSPASGFRIYRGGVYIGSTAATTFTDPTPGSGVQSYTARAGNQDANSTLSAAATITVGADYVFAFGGTAGTAISATDFPSIQRGSAAPASPFLQDGAGKVEGTTGATGSFSPNDKAWARTRQPNTDGLPQRWTSTYTPTTTDNGGLTWYFLADAGAGAGPTTDYLQMRQQSATMRLGYRKSSGTFTTIGTYTRGAALSAGSSASWDLHTYEKPTDSTKIVFDYYEWDPTTGSKPGTPTYSVEATKASLPTAGYSYLGVEGGTAAAASKHKLATILGYKS